ncbi:DUF6879 family protein [Nocardia wallacei]|uniref:DUF6879 family protein n=1 Tax=Nocardia wallacei TaxID=480035 RepID=UPI00245624E4|nr:DUF6879 family protein [Nocardia wallacei]
MQLLPGDEWIDLFQRCTGEAFHLEVRDAYAVPAESEHFRRFLDGEPDDYVTFQQPWLTLMRDVIAKGVAVRRIRVVSVPHSDYHRWVLVATAPSVEAGEDIRYVPRHVAGEVPPDDWWMFDDELLAFNLVDTNGKPAGLAVTTDPQLVNHCRSVKQRLWELAIPYADYAANAATHAGQ